MFCPQCGSSVVSGARFCSSCGALLEQKPSAEAPRLGGEVSPRPASRRANETKPAIFLLAAAILAVTLIVGALMSNQSTSNSGTTNDDAASRTMATDAPTGPQLPTAETKFLASKDAIEARFAEAPNDMVKHQIAGKWQNGGLCPAVQSAQFTDWVGTVKTINYDGRFEIDLGESVLLLGSIDKDSTLFKEASALREGDSVTVSGSFAMDQIGSECAAQATSDWVANTDAGSVQSPIFHVLYSRVSSE